MTDQKKWTDDPDYNRALAAIKKAQRGELSTEPDHVAVAAMLGPPWSPETWGRALHYQASMFLLNLRLRDAGRLDLMGADWELKRAYIQRVQDAMEREIASIVEAAGGAKPLPEVPPKYPCYVFKNGPLFSSVDKDGNVSVTRSEQGWLLCCAILDYRLVVCESAEDAARLQKEAGPPPPGIGEPLPGDDKFIAPVAAPEARDADRKEP